MNAFQFNDGGRAAAGFKGFTGDCACRAISIATGMEYQAAYDLINETAKTERLGRRKRKVSNARTGVHHPTMRRIMAQLGWNWTATMGIGTGCKVHLCAEELPKGRLVVSLSRHYCAVIDGVIHDTHDPRRKDEMGRETRCVYGYWSQGGGGHTERPAATTAASDNTITGKASTLGFVENVQRIAFSLKAVAAGGDRVDAEFVSRCANRLLIAAQTAKANGANQ